MINYRTLLAGDPSRDKLPRRAPSRTRHVKKPRVGPTISSSSSRNPRESQLPPLLLHLVSLIPSSLSTTAGLHRHLRPAATSPPCCPPASRRASFPALPNPFTACPRLRPTPPAFGSASAAESTTHELSVAGSANDDLLAVDPLPPGRRLEDCASTVGSPQCSRPRYVIFVLSATCPTTASLYHRPRPVATRRRPLRPQTGYLLFIFRWEKWYFSPLRMEVTEGLSS
jgi:hypothetical protein